MAENMMKTSDALKTVAGEAEQGKWERAICLDGATAIEYMEAELYKYHALGSVEELAALKERTRWVPVSERLPEEVSSYLVVYHEWSNGDFLPKYDDRRVRVMRFMNNGKWCFPVCTDKRCETDTNREVTHWMPLPEAPKEADHADS